MTDSTNKQQATPVPHHKNPCFPLESASDQVVHLNLPTQLGFFFAQFENLLTSFFRYVKPTLKKVSKYENKFAKLQKKVIYCRILQIPISFVLLGSRVQLPKPVENGEIHYDFFAIEIFQYAFIGLAVLGFAGEEEGVRDEGGGGEDQEKTQLGSSGFNLV